MSGMISAGDLESASDLTTGALIDRGQSASQLAVDRRVQTQVGPLVAEAISQDATLTQAAIDAMSSAAVIADVAFAKETALNASTDLGALKAGTYRVTNGTVAAALGLPLSAAGILQSDNIIAAGARAQKWQPAQSGGVRSRFFTRTQLSGVWGPWTEMSHVVYRGVQPAGFDLNTAVEDGVYGAAAGTTLNRPVEFNGLVEVFTVGVGIVQRYTTVGAVPEVWVRRGTLTGGVGVWPNPWVRVDAGGMEASEGSTGARRELLRQRIQARKGGRIGTQGKGVVALRFDDAPADFVQTVLPLLEQRGLPFTRVTTSERIHSDPLPQDTFETMQTYSLRAGGEVWNHGKTHGEASGAQIIDEVVGALGTLRAAMPRIPIDCFAPPGGSISWDGFMPAVGIDNWAATVAGKMIIANHGLATGYFPDSYFWPIDGVMRDGQNHYSLDHYTLANAKARVDSARDWQAGVVLMWHANNLGSAGNMSVSDFTAVLDYIVAERDAGRIVVLTVSGLACADRYSDARDNLLITHSGSPWSETIGSPQYRSGVPGSTRELTATVSGVAGASVTSKIGESTKVHTIPPSGVLKLRHVATVPLDVSALTVSINAATSGAKLLAA